MSVTQSLGQPVAPQGQLWKQRLPQKWLRLLAIPWTIVLIVGSLMDDSSKDLIGTHVFHRAFHFGSFGATAALYMLLVRTATGEAKAALLTVGLGLALEASQYWIYGGVMEWWDVRDDAVGIAVALLAFRLIARFSSPR